MKKLSGFLLIIFLGTYSLEQSWAMPALNPDEINKVTLSKGYKAEFCQIDQKYEDVRAPVVLGTSTLKKKTVLGVMDTAEKQSLYDRIFKEAQCLSDTTKEIILGDVRIEYQKGYTGNETFFILDDVMYRAGGYMFSYYQKSNVGGTWIDDMTQTTISGLEYIEADGVERAEYTKNTPTPQLSPEIINPLGLVLLTRHFAEDGTEDGTFILLNDSTHENTIYRLTKKLEEKKDIILVDYGNNPITPTDIQTTVSPVETGFISPVPSLLISQTPVATE